MASNEIQIKVDADTTKAKKGLGNLKVAALGVGAGVGLIGVAALKMGAELQDSYNTIRANTGATGDALAGLKDDFKEIIKDVPADFATASSAMAELNTRMGLTGQPLQEMSKQFLNLARVSGVEATAAVKASTRVFGDWGVEAGDSKKTMDMLFRATQVSGVGFEKLSGSLVAFGAPLRAFGFSLEESTALLSKWEKEGVNAELVLGSLKIAQAGFAKAGVPMREGLEDVIEQITKLGPGADAVGLAMKVFGARAGGDMAAAILEGRFAIDEYMEGIAGGSDTINAVAADTLSWREEMTMLKSQIIVAMEPAIMALFDGVGHLIDGIKLLVGWIRDNLGPVFEAFVKIVRPKLDEFFVFLQKKFDEFKGYFDTTIQPALDNIAAAFEFVFGGIINFLRDNWGTIEPIVMDVINLVLSNLETAFDVITGLFDTLMLLISGDFSGAWRALKETIVGLFDNLVEHFGLVFDLFGKLIPLFFDLGESLAGALLKGLKTLGGKLGSFLWGAITAAIDRVPAALKSAVKGVLGIGQSVGGALGAVFSSDEVAEQRATVGRGVMGDYQTAMTNFRAATAGGQAPSVTNNYYSVSGIIGDKAEVGGMTVDAIQAFRDNGGPVADALGLT